MRVVIGAAIVVAVAFGVAAQPLPRIKVRVDAVRVDVLVADGKRPVAGLTKRDFELRDNGVPQAIDRVDAEQMPLDVVLALDASRSVAGEPLRRLRAAARATVASLRPDDRVALLAFSHALLPLARLTTDRVELERAIAAIEPAGATALYDAAFSGLLMAGEPGRRTMLLLYTDGIDTVSWLDPDDPVQAAARTDAVIYAVTPANSRRLRSRARLGRFNSMAEFLTELAESTGGSLLYADDERRLERVFGDIMEEFKNRYQISYYAEGVDQKGWHTIDVKSRKGKVIKARRGYYAQ
jgi:VWFA-related protein